MCLGAGTTALKEFPTDEAGVNVHVGQGDRADFFEVEIEVGAVDGVEIRAFLPGAYGIGVVCAGGGCALGEGREERDEESVDARVEKWGGGCEASRTQRHARQRIALAMVPPKSVARCLLLLLVLLHLAAS